MNTKKYKVACAGATGYAGHELITRLMRHPLVELCALAHSPGSPDQPISDVYPDLSGVCDLMVTDIQDILDYPDLDTVFLALPHTAAMPCVKEFRKKNVVVVDFSADYRLHNPAIYEEWYKTAHTDIENLPSAVYGLCEWHHDAITQAGLIANPGCYPTSALLPLLPLVSEGIIATENIIIDSKSGVSGAGKKVSPALQFAEVNESFKAYGIFTHRHTPEIEQELSLAADTEVTITFTPHLLPVQRGILSTIYATCTAGTTIDALYALLHAAYDTHPFVRIRESGAVELKHVANTNFCDIHCAVQGTRVILTCAIDNLVKGAAGQALQNFNIRFGCDETTGLI